MMPLAGWALRILSVILSILLVVNVFILIDDVRTGRLPVFVNIFKLVILILSGFCIWLAFDILIL